MGGWIEIVRFFTVVRPVPRLTRLTFVLMTLIGVLHLALVPTARTGALMPVFVLQAFTVSSGFLGDARRGHFDVLLTRGVGRVRVAVVYWLLCAAPGIVCWLVVAAACAGLRHDAALFSTGTIVAMLSVSAVPWALTVPSTRFSGALAWLLVILCLAPLWPGDISGTRDVPPVVEAIAFVIVPAWLVGRDALGIWPQVLPSVGVVLTTMMAALVWIGGVDLPLESGQ